MKPILVCLAAAICVLLASRQHLRAQGAGKVDFARDILPVFDALANEAELPPPDALATRVIEAIRAHDTKTVHMPWRWRSHRSGRAGRLAGR